ncbi:MAG: hypothetical protein QNJ64_06945 [Crocosphaera sp.]|nr:hypothetical protein [Crocosphaera sp.]
MTQYIADIVEHQGFPHIEFRSEPDLIPIEKIEISFQPRFPYEDYTEPEFSFGQEVALARDWNYCKDNSIPFEDSYYFYRISALDLVEDVSDAGNGLKEAPYWMYGIRGTNGTRELVWFHEHELVNPFNTYGDEEF